MATMPMRLDRSLFDNLETVARARAQSPAFTFLAHGAAPRTYTYAELFQRAEELAERFDPLGLAPGSTVGILLPAPESQILHFLAALARGLVPTILAPPNPRLDRGMYLDNLRAVLASSPLTAVVTGLDGIEAEACALQPDTLRVRSHPPDRSRGQVGHLAFLQYSSGTTGTRKGILLSHAAVLHELNVYAHAVALDEEDRVASWLPLYHDMGLIGCMLLVLSGGIHCVTMSPLDFIERPASFLRAIGHYGCTLSFNPNFAYAMMASRVKDEDVAGVDLSTLRGLINASEPVTIESQRRFAERFAPLGIKPEMFWGSWGMAEATFIVTHATARDPGYLDPIGPRGAVAGVGSRTYVSVGRPMAGVEIAIRDGDGRELAEREAGDVWVKTASLMSGYFMNPAGTEGVLRDGWYHTGDIGYLAGGHLHICGRRSDMVIVGGVNVYPQDVEETVSLVEGVRPGRVSMCGEFDDETQTERAVVLAESALPADRHASLAVSIRRRLLAVYQLSAFDVHIVPPGWLIKSSSGKMARTQNRQKWYQGVADGAG